MATDRSLARQFLSVCAILVLGVVYVVLLSLGTLLRPVGRLAGSIRHAGGSIRRRSGRVAE